MASPPTTIDLLDSDPQTSDRNWVLMSTLFPESMVEKKELFYVAEFFKKVCAELDLDADKADELLGEFQAFKEENLAQLDGTFNAANGGATSVFGIKIRGVFGSDAEAKERAKVLQRLDPYHNIFLGEVGKWLPLCPNLENYVKNQEYLEPQLNELMRGYRENMQLKDEFFEQRKRENVDAAVKLARQKRDALGLQAQAGAQSPSGQFEALTQDAWSGTDKDTITL